MSKLFQYSLSCVFFFGFLSQGISQLRLHTDWNSIAFGSTKEITLSRTRSAGLTNIQEHPAGWIEAIAVNKVSAIQFHFYKNKLWQIYINEPIDSTDCQELWESTCRTSHYFYGQPFDSTGYEVIYHAIDKRKNRIEIWNSTDCKSVTTIYSARSILKNK